MNIDELHKTFSKRRNSLSDIDKIKSVHEKFILDQIQAGSKTAVSRASFAPLFNKTNATPMNCVSVNSQFNGIKNLPEHLDGPCAPGYAEGLAWEETPKSIRDELAKYIVPGPDCPIAANFFLETAGPDDKSWVLLNQIAWDLFVGGRAMDSLLNITNFNPKTFIAQYEDKCHAVGFTLQSNKIRMYTINSDLQEGSRPRCWAINLMRGWVLDDPVQGNAAFLEALTWFHNASDWARVERGSAIEYAKTVLLFLE